MDWKSIPVAKSVWTFLDIHTNTHGFHPCPTGLSSSQLSQAVSRQTWEEASGSRGLASVPFLLRTHHLTLCVWACLSGPVCLYVSLCVCMKVFCPRIGGTTRKTHRPSSPTYFQSLEQESRCPLSTHWRKVSEPGVRRSCLK